MDNKTIANTIWQQMKTIDKNLCMCMGVQSLTIIDGGLQFKVNGLSFKGVVQITLNGKDLYNVSFLKQKRKRIQNELLKSIGSNLCSYKTENIIVESFEDVFVEDLMPLLERVVEKREAV